MPPAHHRQPGMQRPLLSRSRVRRHPKFQHAASAAAFAAATGTVASPCHVNANARMNWPITSDMTSCAMAARRCSHRSISSAADYLASEYVHADQCPCDIVRAPNWSPTRVCEFEPSRCDRLGDREVTCNKRRSSLTAENLAQPPESPTARASLIASVKYGRQFVSWAGGAARGERARQQAGSSNSRAMDASSACQASVTSTHEFNRRVGERSRACR